MNTEKIVMFDDAEAAKEVTLKGWLSRDNKFFGKDENMARYSGCTHKVCECGNKMVKYYTKCTECIQKLNRERYNALPFKEYDGSPVWDWDGNTFFYNEDALQNYFEENELEEEIELLFAEPIHYRIIDTEDICQDPHEDWEPEKELLKAVDLLNETIRKLPAHSYTTGKVRSIYKVKN